MRLVCLIGRHKPRVAAFRNQGFEFSSCRSCGGDMVRSGLAWQRVPRGFRVVWRPSPLRPASAADRRPRSAGVALQSGTATRPARSTLGLQTLMDLLCAAVRLWLWSLGDRWRGASLRGIAVWARALPRRHVALRLPPP